MFRRAVPVLALALSLAATPAIAAAAAKAPKQRQLDLGLDPSAGFERPDAKSLVREAKDLWLNHEDFTGALAKFNAAVAAAPEDDDVRLQRAHYLEVLSKIVVSADRARFKEFARGDFEQIIANEPDSVIAGVARDGLTRLQGDPLIETKLVSCPAPAINLHGHANALYGAHRYEEAAEEYGRAAAGCPENANWWVDLADTFYGLEDYERAKMHFVKALSVDPWNREAHRYLSDTYVQLGEDETAVRELIWAVVSDPTYEAGWSALRAYGTAMGHKWSRVYGDRKAGTGSPDAVGWAAYQTAKAGARRSLGASAPALAVEREAVHAALGSKQPGPFWTMLSKAEEDGYLDEAIFLHLLDAGLAAEYPAFREKNAGRLASYVGTLLK